MELNAEIILAGLAVLTALGGGLKYVLVRIDQERTRADSAQQAYKLDLETSRTRYETLVQAQIAEVKSEVSSQDLKLAAQDTKIAGQEREISHLHRVADAYIHHVAILHHLMKKAGIEIPELVLPERTHSLEDHRDRDRRRRDRDERSVA